MTSITATTTEQQFTKAYENYANAIFRYCYYRVYDRDKAKDVVQEAYCRTWKYLAKGHLVENLRAFIYKTANHIIIDEVRKRKNVSLHQLMEKGFSPSVDDRQKNEDQLIANEAVDIVGLLDAKYRDVIMLKYIHGLSTSEIASILNETENNIYVRKSRGLGMAKELFARQMKVS